MTRIVVADIGGTNARFALATLDGSTVTLDAPATLTTEGHPSLASAWAAFARAVDEPLPRAAALAIASPIRGETLKLTNASWIVRPARLAEELNVDTITLVNDFGAIAHAVTRCPAEELEPVCGPDAPLPQTGVISVVGPGTGLGTAFVVRKGAAEIVCEAEGGHIDLAPTDTLEDTALARLRAEHVRVSLERLVAGQGLRVLYAVIAAGRPDALSYADDKALWAAALEGSDRLAVDALERWCRALGGAAGDMALAQGAQAVVLAGGLGQRIGARLADLGFAERFVAKGRYRGLMESIPVRRITLDQPGLFGAGVAYAKEHLE